MRFIPYILYLFLIAFYRTNLADLMTVSSISVYLTALIVILVALHKNHLTVVWFSFAAGLIYDAPDPSHMGVSMLILTAIGVAVSQAKDRFNLDSLKSRILLIMGGLMVYAIPHTVIYATSGTSEFFRLFFRVGVPSVLYSAIIGWLFMMIQTGRLSHRKLKSIF